MDGLNLKSFLNAGCNLTKFCVTKDNNLVFVDGDSLQLFDTEIKPIRKHTVGLINDICYCLSLDAVLCCIGSAVHAVDSNIMNEIVFMTPPELELNLLSVISNHSGTIICAGAELKKSLFEKDEDDALIVFWDPRKPQCPIGYYKESHSQDIVSLNFQDGSDYLLMSGSLDGLIVIYDIRQECEDDAVLICVNSEDVVHKCGWLGHNNKIYCTTGSENLLTWSLCDNDGADLDKQKWITNSSSKFLVSCIESFDNEIMTLSLSDGYEHIHVDTPSHHRTIDVSHLVINGADFIHHGQTVLAFSDTDIYIFN